MCEPTVTLPLKQFDELREGYERRGRWYKELYDKLRDCAELDSKFADEGELELIIDKGKVAKLILAQFDEDAQFDLEDVKVIWTQQKMTPAV